MQNTSDTAIRAFTGNMFIGDSFGRERVGGEMTMERRTLQPGAIHHENFGWGLDRYNADDMAVYNANNITYRFVPTAIRYADGRVISR